MADKIGLENRINPVPKTPPIAKSKVGKSTKEKKKAPDTASDKAGGDKKIGRHIDERC